MATKKTYHVVFDLNGGWRVIRGDAERASRHFEIKKDAIEWGRQASRNQRTEFVVHRKDGTIESEDSYGRESFSPHGQDSRQ
jgi:Uncharacterized protein conserved in bacteria (DUF2188)